MWQDDARGWLREVRLRHVLQQRVPELVREVIADDADRGWMVSADQGPTLAGVARERGPHHYDELATAMARIHRTVTAADLAGLELPVFEPRDAVVRFDEMLQPFAALPADHPAHLTPTERRAAPDALAGGSPMRWWVEIVPPGRFRRDNFHARSTHAMSSASGHRMRRMDGPRCPLLRWDEPDGAFHGDPRH